jgi:Arc/MetJ-type ribon-helix-helix transcriptional regulator
MEVHFTPDVQAKLDRLVTETGRSVDEFVQDAMAGYVDELADVRATLDSRYDDLKSGRVKPVSGDEVVARLRAKSAARLMRREAPPARSDRSDNGPATSCSAALPIHR